MLTVPSLVLYTNKLDFSKNPRLGLISLLQELGYFAAQDLVETLGLLIDTRSVYAYIDLYRIIGTDGIAITSVLFNFCLGGIDISTNITKLRARMPRFTSGSPYIEKQLQGATITNYKDFLSWLGYDYVDITQFLTTPLLYTQWVSQQESALVSLNKSLLGGELVSFFQEVILTQLGIDITLYSSYWRVFLQWLHLSYLKYPFGASINQSSWFV